jgi:hypothetical protein
MGDIGLGTSSLTGFSVYAAFTVERKNNEFTLRGNFNRQIGHSTSGFIFKTRTNDRFSDWALLYGRSFRYKHENYFSFALGPSLYSYVDKAPGSKFGYIQYTQASGLGLALQGRIINMLNENTGIGVGLFGNLNSDYLLAGFSINFIFGELHPDK